MNIIRDFHIGIPADTHRNVVDRSYDVSWLAVFATAEDQDTYQTHETHLQFVKTCSHLWEKVTVYDSIGA
jgi:hypothetical protein